MNEGCVKKQIQCLTYSATFLCIFRKEGLNCGRTYKMSSNSVESSCQLLRLSRPKYYTRLVSLKREEGYGIGRTTMIKRWKVLDANVKVRMRVNGVDIDLDFLDGIEFDAEKIRRELRDIIPCSKQENDLCAAETTIFGAQLSSTEYYRYFPSSMLFDMIFTGDLCITFVPQGENLPDTIAIEEEYALSEKQVLDRLKGGETLEDIDTNCRDSTQRQEYLVKNG